MSDAKVRISLVDGTLELEGPESFVTDQLSYFRETLVGGLGRAALNRREWKPAPASGDPVGGGGGLQSSGDLEDIFAETADGVQILCDIPGSSTAAKMVSVAKLLAYGSKTIKSKETITFDEIKAACNAHACYDSKNMSPTLKAETTFFIIGGERKSYTLKLTVPGVKETERLIDEIKKASTAGE